MQNVSAKNIFDLSYLDHLNDPQKKAVLTTDGPVLVLAGAGTGKTRVLTTRLVHLVNSKTCSPANILAVTFTNKAAQEMKYRTAQGLHYTTVDGMWIGTFHSICVRILRTHAERLGLKTHFSILDYDDQLSIVKQIIKSLNIDSKVLSPKSVVNTLSRFKDEAILPERATHQDTRILTIYKLYQERLSELNCVDFGDLILMCLVLFQRHTDVLEMYQHQFRYILVDEYQDTNVAQYLLLRVLSAVSQNICCVGDDDQSIYGWRGAQVGNILRFEQDYPGACVVRLEQNYRSTKHILGAASSLISNNHHRLGKTLWTNDPEGLPILIKGTWDGEDEARFVIGSIEGQQIPLSHVAILVRASYQTRLFEEALLNRGIAYRVVGGLRFYERQEIKDALAYIRLVAHLDDVMAFERIVNLPKRGIGKSTTADIAAIMKQENLSLISAIHHFIAHEQGRKSTRKTLQVFLDDLLRWHDALSTTDHTDVIKTVLDESGYTGMWLSEKSQESMNRLDNLKELMQAIQEFPNIMGFLDHVSLVLDKQDASHHDQVTLMTLHGAKGLEFDTVFLPGWEEGIFPHARCIQESGQDGLEEERRLGYVGISRAKKQLIISYAMKRYSPYQGWNRCEPSRFLRELDPSHYKHIAANRC